jgi:RNA polymerase primary sigma factor
MSSEPTPVGGDDALISELRHQASAAGPLPAGEEAALLVQSGHGNKQSQSRLVASRLAMVIRLAEARRERGLSVADLVQEGSVGLVEAVQSFATSGETDFNRFAEDKVVEHMDAALAAEAAAVREAEQLVAAATDYERTETLLRRTLQRAPTDSEIAVKLEWSVERTRYIAEVVAEARRRHDEELLAFIDPDAVDIDELIDAE